MDLARHIPHGEPTSSQKELAMERSNMGTTAKAAQWAVGIWLLGFMGSAMTRAAEVDAGGEAPGLSEIMVTARKRPQSIESIPASITVVTDAALASTANHDLTELPDHVSGMVFSRAPDDGLALTLRGVGTPARSQAFDQSIALFLDGTYLAKGRLYPIALLDVDRIEVFRGPHSSEVGKNASVGAISVVSRLPGSVNAVESSVSYDLERGGVLTNGAADLQLGPDSALRIAANDLDRNGWVHNGATGHDVPDNRDDGARITYRSNLTEFLSAIARYQYIDHEQIGTAMQLVGPPGSVPIGQGDSILDDQSFAFTPRGPNGESHHETRAQIGSVHFDLAGAGLHWVSETAWVQFRSSQLDDLDFSASPDVDFLRAETFRQFSQEFRLVSPAGEEIEYLAGISYLHSHWHSIEHQYWNVPGLPSGTPIAGQLFNGPFVNDFGQGTTSEAAFLNGLWRVAERLSVSGGVRYTDEGKHVLYGRQNSAPFTLWNTVANPPFPITPLRFNGSFLDGNLAVEYDVASRATLYASYGRGNKLGGFVETNGVPTANPAVGARIESEATSSYEMGLKLRTPANRFALRAAMFDMQVSNFQDTTFNGSAFVTTNLPVRSRGLEFEARWQISPQLETTLAATWDDAQELIGGQELQLTQAPRWTSIASLDYQHTLTRSLRWRAGADIYYRSVMFNQRGEQFPSRAFAPLGLRIAVEDVDGRWGAMLVGRNITNQISAQFAGPTPDQSKPPSAMPEPLRSVLLTGWFKR